MTKNLFVTKTSIVKKKVSFMFSSDLKDRISTVELEAERRGVSFALNEHVEAAVIKLVREAEKQLMQLQSKELEKTSSADGAVGIETDPTA